MQIRPCFEPPKSDSELDPPPDNEMADSAMHRHAMQNVTPPAPNRKRKRKAKNISACQQMIQNLESSEATSGTLTTGNDEGRPRSRFLELPPELRQAILFEVCDDDDLLRGKRKRHVKRLGKVCQTFAADMKAVRAQWRARELQLVEEQAVHRGAFSSYIADLMAPLQSASKTLTDQNRLGSRFQRANQRAKNTKFNDAQKARKKQDMILHGSTKHYETNWNEEKWAPRSKDESDEVYSWREKRESRIGDMEARIAKKEADKAKEKEKKNRKRMKKG